MLEVRQLRHFVAVADELSFARAARKVPIAQSALSASVRSLERSLHTELFKRTGHSIALTESGQVLLLEARKVLRALDEAQDAVADVEGGVRGTIRLGILQALAFDPLSEILIAYRARRPQVEIEVRVEPRGSIELLRAVQQGRLDIAFVALPDQVPTDIDLVSFGSHDLALVVPSDHRLAGETTIAIDDLASEAFVDYPEGWGIRRSVDQVFAERQLQREIVIEVADSQTACALARCGLGIAFVIPSAVGAFTEVLHPTEPVIDLEVALISSKNPLSRSATEAFVALVAEQFSTPMAKANSSALDRALS
jgi:DNA-binding transcriptional LysR family regulator